jgi:DNA-binding CsgD family transcriptional regulator
MAVFIERMYELASCATKDDFALSVGRIAAAYGFDHWMYALDLPVTGDHKRQFMLGGYPDAWVSHYFRNDYLRVDPVIRHCQTRAAPFRWPSPSDVRAADEPTARLFAEAREFGLATGLSIPVHGLGCRWGLVSFAAARPVADAEFAELLPALHLFAHCVHDIGHAHAQGTSPAQMPQLTRRELECLRWAAAGKTSWEIGRLIAISERTVVFHLQNAATKLDTRSRQAAAVRAIGLGLIVV